MKDFTHPQFPTIHIKLLNNEKDLTLLENLLADSSLKANVIADFIPETSSVDAKYLYGIFDESTLVGVIDLIEDYPTKQNAYIHQFFLKTDLTNTSLPETLYSALEKTAEETGITSMEINQDIAGLPLWENLEFVNNKKEI